MHEGPADDPDEKPADDAYGVPSFPAPERPEQPMPQKSSPWPWVLGGLGVSAVLLGLCALALLVYVIAELQKG